jgi:hypothetical protein
MDRMVAPRCDLIRIDGEDKVLVELRASFD